MPIVTAPGFRPAAARVTVNGFGAVRNFVVAGAAVTLVDPNGLQIARNATDHPADSPILQGPVAPLVSPRRLQMWLVWRRLPSGADEIPGPRP